VFTLQTSVGFTVSFLGVNVRSVFLEGNELVEGTVVQKENFILGQTEVLTRHFSVLETSIDLAASNNIFKIKLVILIKNTLKVFFLFFLVHFVFVLIGKLSFHDLSWYGFKLRQFVFVRVSFLALEAEVKDITRIKVLSAGDAVVD
jgi:hypothetical protein